MREIGLAAEVLHDDVLGVGELNKDTINALVNEKFCLIVHSVCVGQNIVLVNVWMNGQVQVVHLLDVCTVFTVHLNFLKGLLDF